MPIVRARKATFAFFILNGFVLGMWVVNIPEIRERTSISTSELGYLFLLLGIAALLGMQIAGRFIDRLGSARMTAVAGVALSLSLIGPGFATSLFALAVALVVLGFSNGMIDVSQNAQAVEVERAYERPIMSAFHAFFSLGGLLAAILGGGLIALDIDVRLSLSVASAAGIVIVFLTQPLLLAVDPLRVMSKNTARVSWSRPVLVLGLLAFVLMLSEGVAYDWSTVHLHDSLGASKTTAAWAFGAFSTAMTVVRLVADRIVARIGSANYVRYAALVGAVGLSAAALSPNPTMAICSWAIFGIGLAGCVPQFFTAAGNLDPTSAGTYLARVTSFGYVGMLAGPAIIGILTDWIPLTTAFLLPIAGCVVASILARNTLQPADRSRP